MGGRENPGVKTTWTKEGIAVSHPMERVQRSGKLLGTGRRCARSRAAQGVLQRATHGYKSCKNWRNRTMSLRLSKFDFLPGEPFRHFYFRFSNKVPSTHSNEHQCFCRYHYCPFHY